MWYAMAFVDYQEAYMQNPKWLHPVLGETKTVNSQTSSYHLYGLENILLIYYLLPRL